MRGLLTATARGLTRPIPKPENAQGFIPSEKSGPVPSKVFGFIPSGMSRFMLSGDPDLFPKLGKLPMRTGAGSMDTVA